MMLCIKLEKKYGRGDICAYLDERTKEENKEINKGIHKWAHLIYESGWRNWTYSDMQREIEKEKEKKNIETISPKTVQRCLKDDPNINNGIELFHRS